mmetsp:Transcript_835/g.1921  ORF Transcript_835/g.1921 Transcript_835/m.1921 type:complete len:588 (-) Transcript_835:1455-3218(-)
MRQHRDRRTFHGTGSCTVGHTCTSRRPRGICSSSQAQSHIFFFSRPFLILIFVLPMRTIAAIDGRRVGSSSGDTGSCRFRALLANAQRYAAVASCNMAATGVRNGQQQEATSRSPSSLTAATTLIEEEASWVMEEEYSGASKSDRKKKRTKRSIGKRGAGMPENDLNVAPSPTERRRSGGLWNRLLWRARIGVKGKSPPTTGRSKESTRMHNEYSRSALDDFDNDCIDDDWQDEWEGDEDTLPRGGIVDKGSQKSGAGGTVAVAQTKASSEEEEHPLRMDEWLVKIKLTGLSPWAVRDGRHVFSRSSICEEDEKERAVIGRGGPREILQVLKFARNGRVLLVQKGGCKSITCTFPDRKTNNNSLQECMETKTDVGKWKLDHGGLKWKMAVAVPPPIRKRRKCNTNATSDPKSTGKEPSNCGDNGKDGFEEDDVAQLAAATADLNELDCGNFPAVGAGGSMDKGRNRAVHNGNRSSDASLSVLSKAHQSAWRTTTLHYRADIHLNKFGDRPRMFKGVVTRDRFSTVGGKSEKPGTKPLTFLGLRVPPRSKLFRPIIATFEADGIGVDTVDTTYRDRGFSLDTSSQQKR